MARDDRARQGSGWQTAAVDDAETIRANKEAEVLAGTFVPRNAVTMKDWLEVWLEDYAPLNAGVGTVEGYEGVCRKHIVPALGSIRLTDLSPETVEVLAKLEGGELYVPALLAVRAGLRRGEVLALRWSDVDLDACRLRVERACDPSKANRGGYKLPKSRESRRTVSFTADVQAALRAHR